MTRSPFLRPHGVADAVFFPTAVEPDGSTYVCTL